MLRISRKPSSARGVDLWVGSMNDDRQPGKIKQTTIAERLTLDTQGGRRWSSHTGQTHRHCRTKTGQGLASYFNFLDSHFEIAFWFSKRYVHHQFGPGNLSKLFCGVVSVRNSGGLRGRLRGRTAKSRSEHPEREN